MFFEDCEHKDVREEICDTGPHYAKKVCYNCEKFLGWLPKPDNDKSRRPAARRELVRKYNFTFCHFCLRTKEQLKKPHTLHAHHIVEYADETNPANSRRENIMCSCTFCHGLIHQIRNLFKTYNPD